MRIAHGVVRDYHLANARPDSGRGKRNFDGAGRFGRQTGGTAIGLGEVRSIESTNRNCPERHVGGTNVGHSQESRRASGANGLTAK